MTGMARAKDVPFASVVIAAAVLAVVAAPFADSHHTPDLVAEALTQLSYRPSRARFSIRVPYRAHGPGHVFEKKTQLTNHLCANPLDHAYALGIARLLSGDAVGAARELGKAVELAQTAPVGPERRAAILNDFAVAHLESAPRNAKSLIIALDAAEKAWALDRTLPVAWTRAVLLSTLASAEAGAAAWDDYLALDHHSLWAIEAGLERARLRGRRATLAPATLWEVLPPVPTSSVSLERFDRMIKDLLRTGKHERAATILLARAEMLASMRSTDEAWTDRVRARLLVSGRTPVTRQVVAALAIASACDGYLYAARVLLLDAMNGPYKQKAECLSHWQTFVKARLAGGSAGAHLALLPQTDCELPVWALSSSARFASDRRDDFEISLRMAASHPLTDVPLDPLPDDAVIAMIQESVQYLYQCEARIEIANGSPAAALSMSDRARTPFRQTSECRGNLTRCIPDGVTLLHQDLDVQNLHTWVVRDGKIAFTSTPVSAARLEAEIERFVADIQRGADADVRQRAKRLYEILVRPVERHIAGTDLLVYSPSANLRRVPFGALYDGGAYLVQRRRIMTTATISSFDLPGKLARTASVCVVLPSAEPGDEELHGATTEVHTVKQIYGSRATLLTGGTATPEAFLFNAPAYDLLHVATHGQPSDLPYQNSIDFGSRRVRAYDILQLRLDRAPVVILAACRTADSSGGPTNLSTAEAFLAAGASAVIGSLWDVEDDDTAELSIAFHRELARGAAPHDALRNVQLESIRQGKPVRAWAAFQVGT